MILIRSLRETRADVGEIVNHADVAGIIDSRPNREPPRPSAAMLFEEDAVAGNNMAAFVKMKVRRCLFLCGDVVEEMVRRCRGWRCGDG